MKRRDFLKKAGLAIAATPILVRGVTAKVPEAKVLEAKVPDTPAGPAVHDWRWRPTQAVNHYDVGYRCKLLLACNKRPQNGSVIRFAWRQSDSVYTIISASHLEKHGVGTVCQVLLDRPLESAVPSDKYWIVEQWQTTGQQFIGHGF